MKQDANQPKVISPGSTIGILGSGQLGRMMTIAAKQMGYRVHVYSPSHDSPAGQVADLEVQASFDDLDSVAAFVKHVDVVTVESESIPVAALDIAAHFVPTFPSRNALSICQNRRMEKQFLVDNQIPTSKFQVIRSLAELKQACNELMPAILKTTTGGYDGKGQTVIRSHSDIEDAWQFLNTDEAILEAIVEYDFEFSIIGARNSGGLMTAYKSIRNDHRNGILDVSISPSGLPDEANQNASKIVFEIMNALESVGVLTVEFFYRNGEVLVNEIAPRPHNSGHLTIEGHLTNQFEQHIRAICGLMAGSTRQVKPVAMANILGQEWSEGIPKWHFGLSMPNTKIHLYGKGFPEPGRKMGHLTSIADLPEQAREHVLAARKLLTLPPMRRPGRTQIRDTIKSTVSARQYANT